ncbi:MAG: matrixin family metalloprotease [Planctomycetaceae bacterium]|nr:matrixin family metalloprotease [Planctomycetaceae bacterium]
MPVFGEQLLKNLSDKLTDKWKELPEFQGERGKLILESKNLLRSAIELLASVDGDLRNILTQTAANAVEDIIESVEERIENYQRNSSLQIVDGVLGKFTLERLFKSKGCAGAKEEDPSALSDDANNRIDSMPERGWYFYYVESLPTVPGPVDNYGRILLDTAWMMWGQYAGVKSQPVSNKALANVIIREKPLHGLVLGQAHVGNPYGGWILEMELDYRPGEWTEREFMNAACHEIGHIIGLHHSANPADLMYPIIPRDIFGPTLRDGNRAKALPWLGPPVS